MKGTIVGIIIVVVIGLLLYGFVKGTYNDLVRQDEGVKTAWAQVEAVLQRRLDLIPNLVETVKGYQIHEREFLIGVTEARAKVAGAGSLPEQIEANQGLSSALSRLLVVVERYPELKANQNFMALQDELAGTENRINVERRRYNETVRDYNVRVRSFPANIVASLFGFERATPFEASPGAETAPKVDFKTPS